VKTNAGPAIVVGTRTRVSPVFLPPPLKFRTAGFPQYGFKREIRTATFATPRSDLYAALAPALAPYGPGGQGCCLAGAALRSALVHRPLARQRVMLSRQVFAYYDLIRASRLLPPIYALDDGSLPFPSARGGKREGPQFTLLVSFFRAVFRTPVDRTTALGCCFIARFGLVPISVVGRRPHLHALRSQRGLRNEAAKFALCYGAQESLAPHRPGRLPSSLHLPSRLQKASNITARANQPIPAAGLSPARPTALWAASRGASRPRRSRICSLCSKRT
jgi:hypothetical protein